MVTIIDYNMGNIASIQNMLKKVGHESIVTSDPDILRQAEKIILPGVGSFDYGMGNLKKLGLVDIIKDKALKENIPVLGICLGMQLLTKDSKEGLRLGLGLIDAQTLAFSTKLDTEINKIPHMGWNYIKPQRESVLFNKIEDKMRFYFVHSFYVYCENNEDSLATTEYGIKFTSVINKDNVYGVQFHPEKSHKFGMKLLKNFVELV